jgi:hypothetical protein
MYDFLNSNFIYRVKLFLNLDVRPVLDSALGTIFYLKSVGG